MKRTRPGQLKQLLSKEDIVIHDAGVLDDIKTRKQLVFLLEEIQEFWDHGETPDETLEKSDIRIFHNSEIYSDTRANVKIFAIWYPASHRVRVFTITF